jgi:hypothetical protein
MRRREMENEDAILTPISERCADNTSRTQQKQKAYVPIKLDLKSSDSILESVQVLERVEREFTYSRGGCKRSEELRQSVRNVTFGPAGVDGNSQILLRVAKKSELRSTIDRQTNQ